MTKQECLKFPHCNAFEDKDFISFTTVFPAPGQAPGIGQVLNKYLLNE